MGIKREVPIKMSMHWGPALGMGAWLTPKTHLSPRVLPPQIWSI